MLGAIGAATIAAHKFWPKGITYGDKEEWEIEKEDEKEKRKRKERARRLEGGSGSGSGSGSYVDGRRARSEGAGGGGVRDRPDIDDPVIRREYLRERYYHRPPLPRAMDGDEGAQFWTERRVAVAATTAARALPHNNNNNHNSRYPDNAYDPEYDDPRYAGPPRDRRFVEPPLPSAQRRLEAPPPPPEERRYYAESRRVVVGGSGGGSTASFAAPPTAPAPPRSYADGRGNVAPIVVQPAGGGGGVGYRDGKDGAPVARGRYYVDGDTVVVPSGGDRTYVIQRAPAPGTRLRERDGDYYR